MEAVGGYWKSIAHQAGGETINWGKPQMIGLAWFFIGTAIHLYRFGPEKAIEEWDVYISYIFLPTIIIGIGIYIWNFISLPAKINKKKSDCISNLENQIAELMSPILDLVAEESPFNIKTPQTPLVATADVSPTPAFREQQIENRQYLRVIIKNIGGKTANNTRVVIESKTPHKGNVGQPALLFYCDNSEGHEKSLTGLTLHPGAEEPVFVIMKTDIDDHHVYVCYATGHIPNPIPMEQRYAFALRAEGEDIPNPCRKSFEVNLVDMTIMEIGHVMPSTP